jgi:hypothetical protein
MRKNHPDKGGDEEVFKRIVSKAHNAGIMVGQGKKRGGSWDSFFNDVKTKVLPEASGVFNVLAKKISDLNQRGKEARVLRGAGKWKTELDYVAYSVQDLLDEELKKYNQSNSQYRFIANLIGQNTENTKKALGKIKKKASGDFLGKQQIVQDFLNEGNLLLKRCGSQRRVVMPTDDDKIGKPYERVVEAPAREGRSASASEGRSASASASASEGRSASASASAPTRTREKTPAEKLAELGITDRRSFMNWVRKNHPDRDGDEETFKKIVNLASEVGWKLGSGKLKRGGMKFAAKPYAKPPSSDEDEKKVVDTMVNYVNDRTRTYRNPIRAGGDVEKQYHMRQCLKHIASLGLVPAKYKSEEEAKYLIPRFSKYISEKINY